MTGYHQVEQFLCATQSRAAVFQQWGRWHHPASAPCQNASQDLIFERFFGRPHQAFPEPKLMTLLGRRSVWQLLLDADAGTHPEDASVLFFQFYFVLNSYRNIFLPNARPLVTSAQQRL